MRGLKFLAQRYHGHLDDVGGTPLYNCVEALPNGFLPLHVVVTVDVRDSAQVSQNRLHIAVALGCLDDPVTVVPDTGEPLHVAFDVLTSLFAADAELSRETIGRDAVDDAEVDRLGTFSHLRSHC